LKNSLQWNRKNKHSKDEAFFHRHLHPGHYLFCPFILPGTIKRGAPALSLSVAEEPVIVQRPFPVELTISWEGDAEQYLVETPGLKLRWPGTGFQDWRS
jgi:hypothetical protein